MSTFFNRGARFRRMNQFFGIPPGAFLPEPDEAEDLVVLLVLAQFAVGIAEDARVGVLDQEGQDALLPPTPLGYVVLFDQGILAMERDRVKIQVKGMSAGQPEPAHGVEPASHQFRIAGRGDPATVFGQERSLGGDVQSGEEGQPLVQHHAHDMAVTRRPEQFQGQQRSQGAAGWDHLRSGETRCLEGCDQGGSRPASAGRGTGRRTWSGTTAGSGRVAGRRRHPPWSAELRVGVDRQPDVAAARTLHL